MSYPGDYSLHDFPDRSIRRLLQNRQNLAELVEAIVPDLASFLDFEQAEPVDRSFLMDDWRRREADLLFRVPFRKGEEEQPALVCILIEHQSAPDPRMPLRILLYAVLYWETEWRAWEANHAAREPLRLTPVLPIVFHTGTEPWRSSLEFAALLSGPEELKPYAPQWSLLLWDLAEKSPESLQQAAGAWLRALAVVRAEREDPETFQAVYKAALKHLEALTGQEEVRRHELLSFLLSWAMRRRPEPERKQFVEVARAAQRDAARRQEVEEVAEMIQRTWDEELQEIARMTRQRALEEGREEGREEGALNSRREALLVILEERFGQLAENVREQIQSCRDSDRLQAAIRQAVRINSPEELTL